MNESNKYSVLVVDDENSATMALSRILSPGYTVYVAKNGNEAVKAAHEYAPDLILLDIVMSEMDGYEVIAAMKGSENTRDIPVIFVAESGEAGDEIKVLTMGAADYITKPFNPEVVNLRVRNQVEALERLRAARYETMNYRLANEAMNIALWNMDVVVDDPVNMDNKFIWSREFRSMLGYNDENDFPNVLRSWSDCLHPEDKEKSIAAFLAHIDDYTGKTPYYIEYRLKNKNGEYRYYDGFGSTLRTGEGIPIRVSGYIRDITEKKMMEKALEQQNNLLRSVNRAAGVLLTAAQGDTFEASLQEGMEIIGRGVGVDCVEVWQNEMRDGELYAVLKHLWLSETGLEMTPVFPYYSFPYSDSPQWESRLSSGNYIQGPFSLLSSEDQDFLRIFKVTSVLIIPIFIQNHFWGF